MTDFLKLWKRWYKKVIKGKIKRSGFFNICNRFLYHFYMKNVHKLILNVSIFYYTDLAWRKESILSATSLKPLSKKCEYILCVIDILEWPALLLIICVCIMNEETHDPRISTLLHICEAFDISLNDFFKDNLFDEVKSE